MDRVANSISAIIIARNEEEKINNCLDSLTWVSEIILVDNESTDNTVARARKYNVRIIRSTTHDFSKLREAGLAHATSTWILYIDADETVPDSLAREILGITSATDTETKDAYQVTRINNYLGHMWPYRDKLLRLFRKDSLVGWKGKLHESAITKGDIGILHESLQHYSHRTISEMVNKTNEWSYIEALLRFNSGHPPVVPWRFIRVMFTAFADSYLRQGGWKVGAVGWIESLYQSFSIFITYAKLWELQKNGKK